MNTSYEIDINLKSQDYVLTACSPNFYERGVKMIYKNKDIVTNINERGIDLGNINVTFYTLDNGTTSLRIFLKKK